MEKPGATVGKGNTMCAPHPQAPPENVGVMMNISVGL